VGAFDVGVSEQGLFGMGKGQKGDIQLGRKLAKEAVMVGGVSKAEHVRIEVRELIGKECLIARRPEGRGHGQDSHFCLRFGFKDLAIKSV
jgi:hypothetical protein